MVQLKPLKNRVQYRVPMVGILELTIVKIQEQ